MTEKCITFLAMVPTAGGTHASEQAKVIDAVALWASCV